MQKFVTHLIGLSILCFVMCFIFLASESTISIPVSLTFSTMTMLSGFTAAGLKHINKRLDEADELASEASMSEPKTLG